MLYFPTWTGHLWNLVAKRAHSGYGYQNTQITAEISGCVRVCNSNTKHPPQPNSLVVPPSKKDISVFDGDDDDDDDDDDHIISNKHYGIIMYYHHNLISKDGQTVMVETTNHQDMLPPWTILSLLQWPTWPTLGAKRANSYGPKCLNRACSIPWP